MKKQTIIISLLFLILLLVRESCNKKEIDNLSSQLTISNLQNQTMDSAINKYGETIYKQQVAKVENEKLLKRYTDSIFNLNRKQARQIKSVEAYYRKRFKVQIDTLKIPVIDSIPYPEYITDSFARKNMITVPRTYSLDSPYFKINTTLAKDGLTINSLSISDTFDVRVVKLKRGKTEYQLKNSNPNVKIEGINSIIHEEKRPFWKKILAPIVTALIILSVSSR
ncbi:hypothetical protein [Leptolyngbya phage Lbo-JY46]